MCRGGKLIADFVAGTTVRPTVPEGLSASLVPTVDGTWAVRAHKVARSESPGGFTPLTGGLPYPIDAVAECRFHRHDAPQRDCTCGFHAVGSSMSFVDWFDRFPLGVVHLDVALSGRILAFDWAGGGVLYRAERQTVVRVRTAPKGRRLPPGDPAGRLASRLRRNPYGVGPVRLQLPRSPRKVAISDDAGYCVGLRPRADSAHRLPASV
jgi:hypothetical protein